MERGAEIKVGLIVLVAAVALAAVIYYIMGLGALRDTYTITAVFDNAQGIRPGDPVMLSGLQVGQVADVSLTPRQRAALKLRINKGVEIRHKATIRIGTGALIGERFVEIVPDPQDTTPPLAEGGQIAGATTPTVQDVLDAAAPLVDNLLQVSRQLNVALSEKGLVGKTTRTLDAFTSTAEASEELARSLAAAARATQPSARQILQDAEAVVKDVHAITSTLQAHLGRTQAPQNIEDMTASLSSAAHRLDAIIAVLEEATASEEARASLRGAVADLRATLANARGASEELNRIMPVARQAVENVNALVKSPVEIKRRLGIPSVRARFDILYSPTGARTWTDANVDVELGRQRFFRVGAVGIGDETDVNAQLGMPLGPGRLRYGLVRSSVGIGYDYPLPRNSELSVDAFDPNDPHVDILAAYGLPGRYSYWSVVGGGRNLLHENDLVLGVRLKR